MKKRQQSATVHLQLKTAALLLLLTQNESHYIYIIEQATPPKTHVSILPHFQSYLGWSIAFIL